MTSDESRAKPEELNAVDEPPMHLGPVADEGAARERFEAHELAMVLSHYDLDVITSIREFPLGSRRSPKLRIASRSGEVLLKRRAPSRSDPFRVAFAHELLVALARSGYPVARLIGTREDNNSLLQLHNRTYELFEFIHGQRPVADRETAKVSGTALGWFHRATAGFTSEFEPAHGTYHNVDIKASIEQLPGAVMKAEPSADVDTLRRWANYLHESYIDASRRVGDLGFADWQNVVVHGDWHPGNMLLRDDEVAAVLDFDSARFAPRIIDVANAALQFSMRTGPVEDPAKWPEGVSHHRIRGLLDGYDSTAENPLSPAERQAVVWLIMEAMIVESVLPIAATGRFAHLPGSTFLSMIEQKVRWLRPRAAKLNEFLQQPVEPQVTQAAGDRPTDEQQMA